MTTGPRRLITPPDSGARLVLLRTRDTLIHHTDCGVLTFTDDEFRRSHKDATGALAFDVAGKLNEVSWPSRPARGCQAQYWPNTSDK